jgi:hypothetical protein
MVQLLREEALWLCCMLWSAGIPSSFSATSARGRADIGLFIDHMASARHRTTCSLRFAGEAH